MHRRSDVGSSGGAMIAALFQWAANTPPHYVEPEFCIEVYVMMRLLCNAEQGYCPVKEGAELQ